MSRNKDLMIDLETMGTSTNAAIIQIGACYFDRYTAEIYETFFVNVELKSSMESGGQSQGETIMWWMEQCESARLSLYKPTPLLLSSALKKLKAFVKKNTLVWSHKDFDFVILTNAFRSLGINPGIPFRSSRDLRTLIDLAKVAGLTKQKGINIDRGTKHNALHDCIYQVKYASLCFNKLKK